MPKRKEPLTVTCQRCGETFQAWSSLARFCPDCRQVVNTENHRACLERKKTGGKVETVEKVCGKCGRLFLADSKRRVLCPECRKENRRGTENVYREQYLRRKIPARRKCPVCGKEFRPVRSNHIYCSEDCRRKDPIKEGESWLSIWADRNPELGEKAVEAKEKGLSYGQLQAQKYLERKKKEEQGDES